MANDYKKYQEEVVADVAAILKVASCQPIIFVGSGFSRRYAGGPGWEELLEKLAAACPSIDKDFAYYKQKFGGDLAKIGSIFSSAYMEWAWTLSGKKKFPAALYTADQPSDIFIKYAAAEILKKLSLPTGSKADPALVAEIDALRNMGPHAVITTNYDGLLEPLFSNYEIVIGQQIFRKSMFVLGEIFKIHGCISDPSSMMLTEADYESFDTDKRYLSAKLLTYFAEHPLLFVGYRANDPNIKNVLYDISRMFNPSMTLSPNIYILQWDETQDSASYPAREQVLDVGGEVNVRIKSITASSFEWVFKAFGTGGSLENVNLKALRSLMARTVNLIRTEIPSKDVEVNYQSLEHAIENGENFANLFGVTSLDNPAAANANHPYTSQMLAEKLGFTHWTRTNDLMKIIRESTGFDMKGSDNLYHVHIKTGKKDSSRVRKYSDAAVDLLNKVKVGDPYQLPVTCLIAKIVPQPALQ